MYERIATIALERPVRVVLCVLAVTALIAAVALPPRVEGDLMRLIPDDHPAVAALAAHRLAPGGQDALTLTFPGTVDIDAIAARVERLPMVESTFHGFTGEQGLKLALLQLEPEQIDELTADIGRAVATGNPALIEPPAIDDWLFPWHVDPLPGLGQGAAGGEAASLSRQDAATPDAAGQTLFVIPTEPAADPQFALALLDELERLVPEGTFIAGPHPDIATAVREVSNDLLRTSGFSLALVAVIVALAFRSLAGPLVLLPPLVIANVLAISAVSLIFGSLNLYTSMGGALVFGLGIDFGIHLVARFREQRGRQLAPADAVRSAWRLTGPPCLTAAATSAAGFFVFVFAEFDAMRQLGVLLALGVLLSFAMTLLLLPILLTRVALPPLRVRSAGAPGMVVGRRTRFLTLAAIVLATATLIPTMPRLEFDYDISAIKSEGLAWDELTPEEQAYRETAFPPVFVAADDPPALHAQLAERIDRGEFPHLRGVVSVASILPPDQQRRLEALGGLIESVRGPSAVLPAGPLRDLFERIGALDTEPVRVEDLPVGLRHLIGARGSEVLLLPRGNMLDLRQAQALTEELEEFQSSAASGFFVEAELGRVIATDLPRVAVLALAMVVLIIVVDLRKPALVALGSGALALGIAWAALALVFFGVSLNIVNIVVLPMLLGIAVDVVVHLLHRLRSGSPLGETLHTTGVAVLFSTLTTIAAFVSLTAADHRGLQSIGLVVLIGLTAMLLAAVVVIASAWPLLADRRRS